MTLKTRMLASIAAACCLMVALSIVKAQTPSAGKIQRIPIPNSDFPISLGVWVPAASDTLYLSFNVKNQRIRSKRNSPTGVKGPQKQKGRSDFSKRPF